MQRNFSMVKLLPDDTKLYPGHDYAEANMNWAMGIEWENPAY